MGVVYRAHDPELVRDVAVKLMNPDAVDEHNAKLARGRLVREARAMARLAHPNVIHVYDVGTVEDGVFIAMELVEGRSLANWLKQPREWLDVLPKFIEAGRGLAAAHAAGIVHRDFKPENVLVGDDGRVRVVDFGLAGAPAEPQEERWHETPASTIDSEMGRASISGPLTSTGTVLGTPKYMAPEQEKGSVPDAASDQFSFCVALFEALHGIPPFAGDAVAEYRANAQLSRIQPVPPETPVPSAIQAILSTGLEAEPTRRHGDMERLLRHLEDALHAHKRRLLFFSRRLPIAIGLLSTCVFAAGLGWAAGRRPRFPPKLQSMTHQLPWVAHGLASASPPSSSTPPTVATDAPNEPSLESFAVVSPDESPPTPPRPATTSAAPPDPSDREASPDREARRRLRAVHVCYWEEDSYKYLGDTRSPIHPLLLQVSVPRCLDCNRPATRRDIESRLGLPDDVACGEHWLCATTPGERCEHATHGESR